MHTGEYAISCIGRNGVLAHRESVLSLNDVPHAIRCVYYNILSASDGYAIGGFTLGEFDIEYLDYILRSGFYITFNKVYRDDSYNMSVYAVQHGFIGNRSIVQVPLLPGTPGALSMKEAIMAIKCQDSGTADICHSLGHYWEVGYKFKECMVCHITVIGCWNTESERSIYIPNMSFLGRVDEIVGDSDFR